MAHNIHPDIRGTHIYNEKKNLNEDKPLRMCLLGRP